MVYRYPLGFIIIEIQTLEKLYKNACKYEIKRQRFFTCNTVYI